MQPRGRGGPCSPNTGRRHCKSQSGKEGGGGGGVKAGHTCSSSDPHLHLRLLITGAQEASLLTLPALCDGWDEHAGPKLFQLT